MVNIFMPPPPKELQKGGKAKEVRSSFSQQKSSQLVRPIEETTENKIIETPQQVSERKEIKNDKTKAYFASCCVGLVLSLGLVGLMIYLLIL